MIVVAESVDVWPQAGVSLTAQEEVKFVCSITSSTKAKIRSANRASYWSHRMCTCYSLHPCRSIDLSLQPKGELMVRQIVAITDLVSLSPPLSGVASIADQRFGAPLSD